MKRPRGPGGRFLTKVSRVIYTVAGCLTRFLAHHKNG
jgi:hypothetical protein